MNQFNAAKQDIAKYIKQQCASDYSKLLAHKQQSKVSKSPTQQQLPQAQMSAIIKLLQLATAQIRSNLQTR